MFHKKQMIWFNPSDRFLGESFVKNKTKIRSKQLLAVIYPFEHILWFTGTNRHFLRNRHLSIYNFKEIFKSRTSIRFFYAIYITRSHLSRSRTCFFSFLIKIRPLTVQRRCFAYKIDFTPFDRANIFLSFAFLFRALVGDSLAAAVLIQVIDRLFAFLGWTGLMLITRFLVPSTKQQERRRRRRRPHPARASSHSAFVIARLIRFPWIWLTGGILHARRCAEQHPLLDFSAVSDSVASMRGLLNFLTVPEPIKFSNRIIFDRAADRRHNGGSIIKALHHWWRNPRDISISLPVPLSTVHRCICNFEDE